MCVWLLATFLFVSLLFQVFSVSYNPEIATQLKTTFISYRTPCDCFVHKKKKKLKKKKSYVNNECQLTQIGVAVCNPFAPLGKYSIFFFFFLWGYIHLHTWAFLSIQVLFVARRPSDTGGFRIFYRNTKRRRRRICFLFFFLSFSLNTHQRGAHEKERYDIISVIPYSSDWITNTLYNIASEFSYCYYYWTCEIEIMEREREREHERVLLEKTEQNFFILIDSIARLKKYKEKSPIMCAFFFFSSFNSC